MNVQDVSVSKYIDSSSPKAHAACCNGTHYATALLTVRKAGWGKPRRVARKWVDKAIDLLKKEADSSDVKTVLKVHFGGQKGVAFQKVHLDYIIARFEEIQKGLSEQAVLCVSKKLGKDIRGKATKQMHLNFDKIWDDTEMAIARTIIHEASHMFAGMHGDNKYSPDGPHEVYADSDKYSEQEPFEAILCADSYGWAAMSLSHKHVLVPTNFLNGSGCMDC